MEKCRELLEEGSGQARRLEHKRFVDARCVEEKEYELTLCDDVQVLQAVHGAFNPNCPHTAKHLGPTKAELRLQEVFFKIVTDFEIQSRQVDPQGGSPN